MLPQAADGCLQYHENAPGSSASESSCPVLSCTCPRLLLRRSARRAEPGQDRPAARCGAPTDPVPQEGTKRAANVGGCCTVTVTATTMAERARSSKRRDDTELG